jgi:hypothetical protein
VDRELHRSYIVQTSRPSDRQLKIQAYGQRASGLKADAAPGKIQSKTYAAIDHTAAPDQLPAHVEIDLIAPVVATFSPY